jgi:hypothetical protein
MGTVLNFLRTGLIGLNMALALFACSCATGNNLKYYIGYINKTGHNLDEVTVYSNGKEWGLATPMLVGGESTAGSMTVPIPSKAEVRITDNGEHKSVVVSIKDVPKDFQDGTIFFVFNRDGTVQAKALKENDTSGHAELIKGLRPKGEYRFGFVNKTGHELQDVTVFYGDKKAGAGGNVLARPQANFTYSDPLTTPCPAKAELRWREDGSQHTVKVKLEGVPNGFEGRIFFVIKANDVVEVQPAKNGDDKTAFELVK